ncbi:hypothetical protein [Cohnella soli]|uniref:Uncharacterized protein n=1 Tax=Cohnella soli TaxID=425005 RepID=A0ABW0HQU3_9BACL
MKEQSLQNTPMRLSKESLKTISTVCFIQILILTVKNSETIASDWDESLFENPNKFQTKLVQLLRHAADEAFAISKQSAAALLDRPRPPPCQSGAERVHFNGSVPIFRSFADNDQ